MMTTIVKDYLTLQKNVDKLIAITGYKIDYIVKKMGMDRTSFYLKRKNGSFTPHEMIKFLSTIKADELEDKVLGDMCKEVENEGIITLEEALNESRS